MAANGLHKFFSECSSFFLTYEIAEHIISDKLRFRITIGYEEDEVLRALLLQRAYGSAETDAKTPFQRAHLGAVFLKSFA